ncbi:MAG TPA: sortase [Candidatus Saccharimonadales bacterium]|nr:sortase [Candidatus Saccharimonadales bacterium]
MNPLFAADDDDHKKKPQQDTSYVLPNRHGRKIQPLHEDLQAEHAASHHKPEHHKHETKVNPAVALIRSKLETMYAAEPSSQAETEISTVQPAPQRSKHQQFMYELSRSGKSLAQIQTEWHNYYVALPDAEKHQVWQEFYANNGKNVAAFGSQQPAQTQPAAQSTTPEPAKPQEKPAPVNPISSMISLNQAEEAPKTQPEFGRASKTKSAKAIHKKIVRKIATASASQTKAVQHAKSVLFGIGSGLLVLMIVLFGLFNEMVIAPFIQPSSSAGSTPIILSSDSVAPTSTPEVIIPKINVEIPVDYSLTTNDENAIENSLESGTVHYPSTVKPGEQGNTAIFGHSSNNIFNPGKYKFAFVLLHQLVPGDLFYLTYGGKVYTYKVYTKQVVKPSQVEVLNNVADKTATATLITCDPPGTSLNRLVVWGEQVSPDPSGATAPTATATTTPAKINGNGPSLWTRFTNWVTGKSDSN